MAVGGPRPRSRNWTGKGGAHIRGHASGTHADAHEPFGPSRSHAAKAGDLADQERRRLNILELFPSSWTCQICRLLVLYGTVAMGEGIPVARPALFASPGRQGRGRRPVAGTKAAKHPGPHVRALRHQHPTPRYIPQAPRLQHSKNSVPLVQPSNEICMQPGSTLSLTYTRALQVQTYGLDCGLQGQRFEARAGAALAASAGMIPTRIQHGANPSINHPHALILVRSNGRMIANRPLAQDLSQVTLLVAQFSCLLAISEALLGLLSYLDEGGRYTYISQHISKTSLGLHVGTGGPRCKSYMYARKRGSPSVDAGTGTGQFSRLQYYKC